MLMPAIVHSLTNNYVIYVNLLKFALVQKFVKSIQANLFSADFSHLEPLSVSAEWSPKILERDAE